MGEETEDVWCCAVCTYQNNMLLVYCELCGCKQSKQPNVVKRVVYPKELSPSPASPENPDNDILDILDNKINRNKNHRKTVSDSNVIKIKQNALKYWQCSVCTFNANPIDYPVCKMCSALPLEQPPSPNAEIKERQNQKKPMKEKKMEELIEMDPLGQSSKIPEVPIMDKSFASNKSQTMLAVQGGVGYHAASRSGQNIIKGLEPNDKNIEIPDLPPEKKEEKELFIKKEKEKEIKGTGISGFVGKLYNGWSARRRAQSTLDDQSEHRARSKSPFNKKKKINNDK